MASFFKLQPFENRGGKIYFKRGRSGPFYEVSAEDKAALEALAKSLRTKMIVLVSTFVGVFLFTLLLLPQIMDLNFQMALIVVFGLIFVSFLPFLLLVKFNLSHQKKIRGILGTKEGVVMPAKKPADAGVRTTTRANQSRTGVNTNALIFLFLLGIAITAVGIVMLYSGGEMPFRKQFIWWMNVLTGSMLTGLGFYGLLKKKPKNPNAPTPPNDDQGGQP